MVTPDELAAIHERMAEAGISNAGAYVRKMALNGYIPVSYTHLDVYKRQLQTLYDLLCSQPEGEAVRLATALEIYVSGSLN